jgi:hypothetical protein
MFKIVYFDSQNQKQETKTLYDHEKAFRFAISCSALFDHITIIEKRWNPLIGKMVTYEFKVKNFDIYLNEPSLDNLVYSEKSGCQNFMKLKNEIHEIIPVVKDIYEKHGFSYYLSNEYSYSLTIQNCQTIKNTLVKDPFIREIHDEIVTLRNITNDLRDICDFNDEEIRNFPMAKLLENLEKYRNMVQVE